MKLMNEKTKAVQWLTICNCLHCFRCVIIFIDHLRQFTSVTIKAKMYFNQNPKQCNTNYIILSESLVKLIQTN